MMYEDDQDVKAALELGFTVAELKGNSDEFITMLGVRGNILVEAAQIEFGVKSKEVDMAIAEANRQSEIATSAAAAIEEMDRNNAS